MICDLALVLLMDSSGSVAQHDWQRQVEGHAQAMRTPHVHEAIARGEGVAIRADSFSLMPTQLVGWRVLRNQADVESFVAALVAAGTRQRTGGPTMTSTALAHAREQHAAAPCQAGRRVTDLVTDGVADESVTGERDAAQEEGIEINALFIETEGGQRAARQRRYESGVAWLEDEAVTTSGRVFMAQGWADFVRAIRSKIVWEIARRWEGDRT